jgi:hypothetical protein
MVTNKHQKKLFRMKKTKKSKVILGDQEGGSMIAKKHYYVQCL